MTAQEKRLQNLLNELVLASRAVDAMAKRVYGAEAHVFAEAEGTLCVMVGDDTSSRTSHAAARQKHIRLTAQGSHALGVGAW